MSGEASDIDAADDSRNLVTVVVPAYNASRTISATIASVRAQSWRQLEIIVVDDGSTDDTAAVAERAGAGDLRVRVIRQANAGVSAARNAAARAGSGAFIAPIDSDDIWHPEKIARQMRRMAELGAECGFVYCLSRTIDMQDRIIAAKGEAGFEGEVYLRALAMNFVGNGSALLIRRSAFDSVGGYLPDRACQSVEDWLIQAMIARRWRVGAVTQHLTGYRQAPGSLSSDPARHKRAKLAALAVVAAQAPETPRDVLAAIEAATRVDIALAALRRARLGVAARETAVAFRCSTAATLAALAGWAQRAVRAGLRRVGGREAGGPGPDFFDVDPLAMIGRQPPALAPRLAARLALREGAAFAAARHRAGMAASHAAV